MEIIDRKPAILLQDRPVMDHHLIYTVDDRLRFAEVKLLLTVIATKHCNTCFYINEWGGVDLAVISAAGSIVKQNAKATVFVSTGKSSELEIEIRYVSSHSSVLMGTYAGAPSYHGTGHGQFLVKKAEIHTRELEGLGKDETRLALIDVGAEGGLSEAWVSHWNKLAVTFVEPSPLAAAQLRTDFPGATILEVALLDRSCRRDLHITRLSACSSLLKPDMPSIRRWKVAPAFDVVRTIPVECVRYDDLYARDEAPAPDVIKIDVQGVELLALQGFGDLLCRCIAVELEAHLYRLYEKQPLLHHLVSYLETYGLMLRKMEPQMNFDGDLVEVNAYFTTTGIDPGDMDRQRKLALVEDVWGLSVNPEGERIASLLP